jgi:hypothetical protein
MPARVLWAQGITPSDVEQQVRASLAAWNAGDLDRIVDTPGLSNNPGIGFGWRTRNPRVGESREHQLETIRPFFASVEYYRITDEEIHTAVDGDVGLAWGFFTEDFQVRGRAPERIRVRFTTAFKREGDGLRQVLCSTISAIRFQSCLCTSR